MVSRPELHFKMREDGLSERQVRNYNYCYVVFEVFNIGHPKVCFICSSRLVGLESLTHRMKKDPEGKYILIVLPMDTELNTHEIKP